MSAEINTEADWEAVGLGIAGRQLASRPAITGDLMVWDTLREIYNEACEYTNDWRIYRRIPVPKQGDYDVAPEPTPQLASLPTDASARKKLPVFSGVLQYFPDAILSVAHCSYVGNQQHNPGQPLHWDRAKSMDHPDCEIRHMMQRGTRDSDGVRHSAKRAWRALADLQLEIENDTDKSP